MRLSKRKGYVINNIVVYLIFGPCLFTLQSPAFIWLFARLFFDIAGFFVCFVLIEYVICSVLIGHVQRFEPQVGCSQRDSAL